MAHFTVIGLGRFGIAASLELIHLGHSVTGVDRDPRIIEKYVEDFTQAVVCDSSDESALRELDLMNSEAVLVAIGEDMQSSLLCTLALKNLGVEEIWVKASTRAHHTIVSKLGVSKIIHPEEEMGIRVAQLLNYPMVDSYLSVGHGLYVVEVHVQESLHGKTVAQVLSKASPRIMPIMIKKEDRIFTEVDKSIVLQTNDTLLLCGSSADLKYIASRIA